MRLTLTLVVAGLMAMAAPAGAATPGESELNRAVIAVKRQVIVETNMNLDAATAKIFWPLYNNYTEAMRKPNDRLAALLTEYAANWRDLSDENAKQLVSDFIGIRQEQLKIKKSHIKKFSKSLPPKIVARFFQIDNKLDAIIDAELARNLPLVH